MASAEPFADPPSPSCSSQDESTPLIRPSSPSHPPKPWFHVIIFATLIILLTDLGSLVGQAPLARLYESILCAQYWKQHDPSRLLPDGSVPEELCKLNSMQDTVAVLFGWQWVWDAVPGIALAIPYGNASDRWGRKPVLWLCLIGFVLNLAWMLFVCYQQLPLYAVWFSSAFLTVGGGPVVGSALIFTVAADVASHEERTSVFLWMHAAILVAEMVGPAIGSALMRKSVWLPLVVALIIQTLPLSVLPFLPETLHHRPAKPSNEQSMAQNEEHPSEFPAKPTQGPMAGLFRQLKETVQFILHDRDVTIAVSTFTFSSIGYMSATIFLQYVSKRYHWPLADAALLGTVRAAVNLLLFLVILPALNNLLARRMRLTPERTNLEVAKWSAILMSFGFLVIALSPNAVLMMIGLIIYTSGTGFLAPMRSVCIALIGGEQSHRIGQLFATVSMMGALGNVMAGPLLPLAFHWGQQIGGMGLGMPFLLCALMLGIVAVEVFFIRLPDRELEGDDDEEDREETEETGDETAGMCNRG